MKERIVVEYGEVNKIAELMGCTNVMVSHALAFRKNSKLARSIRKLAIERGCVLYFCMSFGILLSIFFINPLLELLVVLNFGISVRLLKKHVPLNDLED